MRKYITICVLWGVSLNLSAQEKVSRIQSRCRNIYVWDFLDQDKNKNRTTNDITEAVEEALTNIDECFVLQRRNLATLVNHAAAEKGISSVKEMRYEITHALSGSGAKLVLFGTVDMSARDACEVKLRVEDLATSRIVIAKSTRILYSKLADVDSRNTVIYQLVCQMVGKLYTVPPPKENVYKALQSKINPPVIPKKSNGSFTIPSSSGLSLIMGTCVGDSYNQTVTINFTFINNIQNQVFAMPNYSSSTFASDDEGNQYSCILYSLGGETSRSTGLSKQFFTGTKLRASITFGSILPSIKKLTVAKVRFNEDFEGGKDDFNGEVTFRDLEINWK